MGLTIDEGLDELNLHEEDSELPVGLDKSPDTAEEWDDLDLD